MTRAKDISKILTDADISGNIDVDGVTNLDVVDIDGAVDMASTLQVDGAITSSTGMTITTADNTAQVTLVSTDADENSGPQIDLYRNSASPANNDLLGRIVFYAENDADEKIEYGNLQFRNTNAGDGAEDATILLVKQHGGSAMQVFGSNATETVFNDNSVNIDFRVESNGNENMLFVDGGNDAVGIGNNNPNDFGANTKDLVIGTTSGEHGMTIVSGTGNGGRIQFADNTGSPFRGAFEYDHNSDSMIVYTAGSARLRINDIGSVLLNTTNAYNARLGVVFTGSGSDDYRGMAMTPTSGTSHTYVHFHNTGVSTIGSISGNNSNIAYNTSSDYRLKENVSYDFDATTELKKLKPAKFNFIGESDTIEGFLAHEVADVVPLAITGTKDETKDEKNVVLNADGTVKNYGVTEEDWTQGKSDGIYENNTTWVATKNVPVYQGIDQSKLVPLLVKTIQELEARITALESA